MPETCWFDLATVLNEGIGNLAAGVPLTALAGFVAWVVGRKLHIFERREERKERERRETWRAKEWLLQLRDEVGPGGRLVEQVPRWQRALGAKEWGKVFNVLTPSWDVAERSGELARLVKPEVLCQLARFYGGLDRTRMWVREIGQSWFVPRGQVESEGKKRDALVEMAKEGLGRAEMAADGLVEQLDSEVERLTKRLEALGGGGQWSPK